MMRKALPLGLAAGLIATPLFAQSWKIADVQLHPVYCAAGQVTIQVLEFNQDGSGRIQWENSYKGAVKTQAVLWWEPFKINPVSGEISFDMFAHRDFGPSPVQVKAYVGQRVFGYALIRGNTQQAAGTFRYQPPSWVDDEFSVDIRVSNCDGDVGTFVLRRGAD